MATVTREQLINDVEFCFERDGVMLCPACWQDRDHDNGCGWGMKEVRVFVVEFVAAALSSTPPAAPPEDALPLGAWCDVCAGTGKLLTGKPCDLCRSTGCASMALIGLREKLLEAEQELDRLTAQAPPASDPPGLSAEATLKSLEIGFCSSNCGPVYRADEDGCCVTCGGDITFHDRSRPLGQTRCTVCRDTALPCQLGHTGRMLGPQPVAQAPHASDPPGLVANWRPIETAPKRTDVLAGWADRPHWLPQVLQQDDAGMWFNGEESDYRPPTHWMPLPASPQAKED